MAITNLSQMTPELAAAASSLAQPAVPNVGAQPGQNTLAGPGDSLPLGQDSPPVGNLGDTLRNALANPVNGVPLTFNDRFKDGFNAAAEATPPAAKAAPGAWARQLIAGATHAVGEVQDTLADAASAAKGAIPGEGGLAAIGRIKAAESARKQAAQKAQTDEDKDRAMIAHENVQTLYQQKLLHRLGDQENHEDIANGSAAIDNFTTHLSENGLQPAPIIAKDVTEAQAQKAIHDNNFDASYNHMWPTSSFQPFDPKTGKPMVDKDGQPMLQKMYTIIGNVPDVVLNEKNTKLINGNIPGLNFEVGQHLSGAQAGSLIQQAMNHQTHLRTIEAAQKAADVADMTADQKLAQLQAIKNLGSDFGRVLANADGDAESALKFMTGQHMIKGVDPKTGKPGLIPDPASQQMAKDHPNAYKDLMDAFGGAVEFSKIVNTQTKEAEQARHDRAKEAEDAQKEKDKQDKENSYVGDDNAATPEAFLASLKPGEAATVKGIAEGSLNVGRMAYLLARNPSLIAAVKRYDPSFDNSKVEGYAKNVTDFTSGKVGESLKAGATAFNHLRELYDLNTLNSRIPGTSDAQKYENKLDTVASELAKFYGDTTIPAIEGIKKTLGSFFNRGAAIETQARSMADRYDNIKQQWIAGAPSEKYYGKMPDIDNKAKNDMQYLLNKGAAAPGVGPGTSGKAVSLAAAMALPINKGKSEAQVRADIEAHGHQVGQ